MAGGQVVANDAQQMSAGLAAKARDLVGDARVDQVKAPEEVIFYVWPENWRAKGYFEEVHGQWLTDSYGGMIALNGAFLFDWIKADYPKNIRKVKRIYRDVMCIANGYLAEVHNKRK